MKNVNNVYHSNRKKCILICESVFEIIIVSLGYQLNKDAR